MRHSITARQAVERRIGKGDAVKCRVREPGLVITGLARRRVLRRRWPEEEDESVQADPEGVGVVCGIAREVARLSARVHFWLSDSQPARTMRISASSAASPRSRLI
jgi:hypothetical protein